MGRNKSGKELSTGADQIYSQGGIKKLIGIFSFVRPYMYFLILGLFFLLLSSVFLLAFPYLIGKLIDAATGKGSGMFGNINSIALSLIAILFIQSIFSYLRVYLFSIVSERSIADIKTTLYKKYLMLPIAFYDRNRTGELLSRITADISLIHDSLSITLAELIRQITTLVAGTAIIAVTSTRLTVFMLAVVPLIIFIALFFGRFIRKLSKKTQDEVAKTNIIVEETLQAIREVKSFTNEMKEATRYGQSITSVINIALKTARFRGAFISFIIFALFGAIVAVIWYGTTLVGNGLISVGDLLSFVLYTTFIGGSIAGLGDIYSQFQRTIGASERIIEILDEKEEPYVKEEPKEKDSHQNVSLKGKIDISDLHFNYPTRPDMEVLKGINLSIQEGQKIALVGHSGAGKSTIIQLLLRFYDPLSGSIKINGTDISHIRLQDYRDRIALVPQEVILFGGSIRENIAYGDPKAADEMIIEAARKANALEFIEKFPDGMDTLVGERGIKLSGGQRQRIAIARAILRDPELLILDEATSSLDANTEYLVKEALNTLMENRTTIIIAHRLATIQMVDNIFVIEGGQIVESGRHEQLIDKIEGIYASLVKKQLTFE